MMVPVVIGALTKRLKNFLEILDIKTLNVYLLQKTTLLYSTTCMTSGKQIKIIIEIWIHTGDTIT